MIFGIFHYGIESGWSLLVVQSERERDRETGQQDSDRTRGGWGNEVKVLRHPHASFRNCSTVSASTASENIS